MKLTRCKDCCEVSKKGNSLYCELDLYMHRRVEEYEFCFFGCRKIGDYYSPQNYELLEEMEEDEAEE